MDAHDLTSAYALDALDRDEAEAYERHLSQCEECREQLAELNETASALAFSAVAPAPPARLRASILDAAAAERSNVVPFVRRRWVTRGLAVAAAAVACIAVGLGVSLSQSSHPPQSWTVAVGQNGKATISVSGLASAPHGKTYEAWVIPAGHAARPAGLFSGSTNAVHLSGTVPQHAVVAVTLEPAGGSKKPTTTPIFSTST
ncbi:MAG TPA: anti-sigma factor [Gaiellaceae bacterium]|jgi:anti-sigma-K factor RskA|nr:anti-sigma factor [Gaiellaceae bacterium]